MGKYSRPKKSHRTGRTLALLGALIILAAALLVIMPHTLRPAAQQADIVPTDPTTETEPVIITVVTANGQPESLTCFASYTCTPDQAEPGAVVAVWGDAQLTNQALQIYYLNAIRTHQSGSEVQPDLSQPLESQRCPLVEENISWQHYFLDQAIRSWQTQQALLEAAKEPRPITEEAYKPNEREDLHGEYVSPDLPVNQFLYQDQPCYKPNTMHQSYLDGLGEQMDELAAGRGYADLNDCAQRVFGGLVSADDLIAAARDYNFAYMYFTEWSYDTATDEELSEYLEKNPLPENDAYTVDMRHVLLIPEDAEVASDGTVTASEEQWKACEEHAKKLLQTWSGEYLTTLNRDANFARLANRNSQDAGSRVNGGLYQNVRRGQLINELDSWCFSEDRKEGEYAILRSPLGCHIVFFRGSSSVTQAAVRDDMFRRQAEEALQKRREAADLKIDYSAAALWADWTAASVLPVDTLYADVAHERFPEVMVYFQQDYSSTPYGASYVGVSGCGVSVLAMVATYMNDTVITPAMMAKRYSSYYLEGAGTRGELFIYMPEELGFFLDRTAYKIDEFAEALMNGQLVVDLQYKGYFTTTGHYMLLSGYNPEDDTFQVRDSNIKNYKKLEGNKTDRFTRDQVKNASNCGYIMQKKITRIPACARCGGTFEDTAPEKLLTEDYICPKCSAAIARRSTFLELMGA